MPPPLLHRLPALKDSLQWRLRGLWYRALGVRLSGRAHLRRVSIPRGFGEIEIHGPCALDDHTTLLVSGEPTGEPKIRIGRGVYINRFSMVDASARIEIGEGTMIGPGVYITDHDHGMAADRPIAEQPLQSAPVLIEADVWIGAHAVILKGVTLGRGAVVAAGAVVTRDVPAGMIVAGVPAKPVRPRA